MVGAKRNGLRKATVAVARKGYSPYVPLAGPTRKTCQLSICLMKSPQIGAIRSPWKSET